MDGSSGHDCLKALELAGLNLDLDDCLMRVPLINTTFSAMTISYADLIYWIRLKLAFVNVDCSVYSRVSSHSCKASVLALAARGGMDISHVCYFLSPHGKPVIGTSVLS